VVLILAVGAAAAHADLTQWVAAVNAGSPYTYLATQISPLPTTVNIGTLSGDITMSLSSTAKSVRPLPAL